ncbi:hypothetical protein MBLNU230_g0768t1 [Neophaeotheca triangularis]
MINSSLLALTGLSCLITAQYVPTREPSDTPGIYQDSIKYGPEIELVHLYNDQFPTGITVSREGRMFSNYPPALDANNTNNGENGKYTIAEIFSDNTERPYPSFEMNNPPGGDINYTTPSPTGANYQDYLIGSQSCVMDSANRLWILDTGRALTPDGTRVPSSYGGPKIVGVDLETDTVFQTIVFPETVAYPDSYLNDLRFDLRPETTESGKGIAYITDSSPEGRNGIVVVDLGTCESWRHLDGHPSVRPQRQFSLHVWGVPVYSAPSPTPDSPFGFPQFGADGLQLSADGDTLYWKTLTSRDLYSIPTARLRARDTYSELLAQGAINSHTQTGVSDGMQGDTNGYIYYADMENHGVNFFNPANGTNTPFVRDPRMEWLDTFSAGWDGYLYWTNNQLCWGSGFFPGDDRRTRPFSLWRAALPNNATRTPFS